MRVLSFLLPVFLCACISLAEDVSQQAPPEPAGMKPLFDGQTLNGWEGDPRLWSIKDGIVSTYRWFLAHEHHARMAPSAMRV